MTFKLDRLGRSLAHLVKVLADLKARGIGFETCDGISTRDGATGELVLHILASVAQFERALVIERTMAGLAAARAEGKTGGRKRKDITAARKHMIEGLKAHQVAKMYGVSEPSLWRNLKWADDLAEVRPVRLARSARSAEGALASPPMRLSSCGPGPRPRPPLSAHRKAKTGCMRPKWDRY